LLLHQRRTPWPPHCNTWSDVVAASSMVAADVAVSLVETLYASALQSSHSTTESGPVAWSFTACTSTAGDKHFNTMANVPAGMLCLP
jgi:hypothetical protein